jgi:glutaredoxin
MKKLFVLVSLLVLANVQAGELYRSVDKDGKVHYSDTPYMGTEDIEALKVDKAPTADAPLSYETQRAKQYFPVTLYTFPDCGSVCKQARDLLVNRGIPFTDKSLVSQEDIDAFRKNSGDSQLPAMTVGKTWLKGFLAEQWNSELDNAGYPKKALGYRPAAPAAQPAQ